MLPLLLKEVRLIIKIKFLFSYKLNNFYNLKNKNMKKIAIIASTIILLSSCGQAQKIENKQINTKSTKIEQTKNLDTKKIEKKEVSFNEVEKNLQKLKNLNSQKLEEINNFLKDFYNRNILEQAKKSGNLNECDKLENKNSILSCKKEIIISKKDENLCSKLSNSWSIISCKNEIFRNKAQEKLDENICTKIIDDTKEKIEINSCKNRVLEQKAIKNLDPNICKKIQDKNREKMCEEIVKIEQENKKREQEMKKQDEKINPNK